MHHQQTGCGRAKQKSQLLWVSSTSDAWTSWWGATTSHDREDVSKDIARWSRWLIDTLMLTIAIHQTISTIKEAVFRPSGVSRPENSKSYQQNWSSKRVAQLQFTSAGEYSSDRHWFNRFSVAFWRIKNPPTIFKARQLPATHLSLKSFCKSPSNTFLIWSECRARAFVWSRRFLIGMRETETARVCASLSLWSYSDDWAKHKLLIGRVHVDLITNTTTCAVPR